MTAVSWLTVPMNDQLDKCDDEQLKWVQHITTAILCLYYSTNTLRTQQNFYFVAFRKSKNKQANVWPF